jgi:ketosteroid isomerase-like protein
MTIEQRLHVLEEGAKGLNAGDWDAYGRVFAEDVLVHSPGQGGPVKGRAARVQVVRELMEAFPDGVVEVTGTFGQDDFICVECTFAGTHTGPLAAPDGSTIPPTTQRVDFPYCLVMRFEGDEVVELHEYYDQLEILMPLGVLAPAGA